ncbi:MULTISPECIES: hypothetical protein [unclassified Arthrobacter]|uniref:hypothetical protein n=1 Tax=unclassified Arthrobacter TaxID=235627 RepID=UPI002DFF0E9C|nr:MULTISPECIES: hypothetical protein [unclassified Arthrobacter]MEC5191233.1 hypothetical protein [Arthrobacter sp. MP_M4]MEC5202528.1 hypothetical protein [Arthrobacter sp. MP_M7]
MSDICFPGGLVAELAPAAAAPALSLAAPIHCGMPMEWKTPGAAAMSVYSFSPPDAAIELPPLWRCACGFQRDGVLPAPAIAAERSR